MKRKTTMRSTAAIISSVLAVAGSVSAVGYAETPDSETTTAVTSESTSSEAETSKTTETTEDTTDTDVPEEETKEDINWVKTDISEYDASMSLVSYEITTPEMLQAIGGSNGKAEKHELTEEEVKAMVERRKAIKKKSPSLTRKSRNAEPTAVELYLSGKPVGYVPPAREVYATASPGDFAFVTYGWGHGVGMSQNGANLYATYSGWTYQDILFHYYPGTYLVNTNSTDDEVLTINHEPVDCSTLELLSQIVFNEVGGSMSYEAIKAQAVAAYTYIKFNGDDVNDLRPKANPPQIVIDACQEVLGEALFYDEDYALTMFSASCGGCSANCYEIFYQDVPYLRSVPSDWDGAYDPHFGTVTYVSSADMKRRIESRFGVKLSDDPSNWIQPLYSEETGYVTDVCIDGQMWVKGYNFSLSMGIKSPKFNVSFTPTAEAKTETIYEPEWTDEDDFIEDYEEAKAENSNTDAASESVTEPIMITTEPVEDETSTAEE